MAWLCRFGIHKKRPRQGAEAERTFIVAGVNLEECARCDWKMLGVGEMKMETVIVPVFGDTTMLGVIIGEDWSHALDERVLEVRLSDGCIVYLTERGVIRL